jgi:hypothetical protein
LEDFEDTPERYLVMAGSDERFRPVDGGYEAILKRDEAAKKPWKDLLGDEKSYMELNRKKYGDARSRPENEKIQNRITKAKVTKITIKRNADGEYV